MAAGGDEDLVAILRMEHDSVDIAIEILIQKLPSSAAVLGLDHVAHLQSDVHRVGFFGINGDVTHVGLDSGHRIGGGRDRRNVPNRIESGPVFSTVPADEDIDGFGTSVNRVGIAGINGEAANFSGTALAVTRFRPGSAEIFTQPDAVAAGSGKHFVGRRRRDRNFRNFPIFKPVMLYFPRTAILAFECQHAFVCSQIEYRCHSFFLLPFESESTTEPQGRQPDLAFALNGSSRSKSSNRSSRSIAELFVDYVKERLACDETLQVLDEDRQKRRPLFFGEAADSRANDNIGRLQSSESSGRGWRANASSTAPAIHFSFNARTRSLSSIA